MRPVLTLSALLGTMGSTTDDGTLVLSAITLGGCAQPFAMLSKLQTVSPDLNDLLPSVSKQIVSVLEDLKPQLASDKRDPKAILEALGKLGNVVLILSQKMMEIQQMPPFGGAHSE